MKLISSATPAEPAIAGQVNLRSARPRENVCWAQDFTPYFEKMKGYGANTMRIWLCPWGLNLERKTEPGSYDLQTAERIDKIVAQAEASGVRLIFCFTFHGMNQGEWGNSPYNSANGGPCAGVPIHCDDHTDCPGAQVCCGTGNALPDNSILVCIV